MRTRRSVSGDAMHASGSDFLRDADSFETSMKALEEKTGAKLTQSELDGAIDRLKTRN